MFVDDDGVTMMVKIDPRRVVGCVALPCPKSADCWQSKL